MYMPNHPIPMKGAAQQLVTVSFVSSDRASVSACVGFVRRVPCGCVGRVAFLWVGRTALIAGWRVAGCLLVSGVDGCASVCWVECRWNVAWLRVGCSLYEVECSLFVGGADGIIVGGARGWPPFCGWGGRLRQCVLCGSNIGCIVVPC